MSANPSSASGIMNAAAAKSSPAKKIAKKDSVAVTVEAAPVVAAAAKPA